MKKAVIFDVDGTLLDTTQGVLSSVEYTIKAHRLPSLRKEQLLTFIGPPIQDSFARTYGLEGDILQELAATFRNRYKEEDLYKAAAYDGIYEVCDELKRHGIAIAVATYKRQDYAVKIMRHFGFDRYTDIIYGADHENKLKKVDIIRKCLVSVGISDYGDAVMVGDSDHDAIGAQKVGIDFIGVTYGFGFKAAKDAERFANTIGVAEKAAEILGCVGVNAHRWEQE